MEAGEAVTMAVHTTKVAILEQLVITATGKIPAKATIMLTEWEAQSVGHPSVCAMAIACSLILDGTGRRAIMCTPSMVTNSRVIQ